MKLADVGPPPGAFVCGSRALAKGFRVYCLIAAGPSELCNDAHRRSRLACISRISYNFQDEGAGLRQRAFRPDLHLIPIQGRSSNHDRAFAPDTHATVSEHRPIGYHVHFRVRDARWIKIRLSSRELNF